MNDVPHQWILDKLTALCLLGEMDKEEVERIHALFVQRFPDEVAKLKKDFAMFKPLLELYMTSYLQLDKMRNDLEQQGDNYITESARE